MLVLSSINPSLFYTLNKPLALGLAAVVGRCSGLSI
jgi:hypothetical protein